MRHSKANLGKFMVIGAILCAATLLGGTQPAAAAPVMGPLVYPLLAVGSDPFQGLEDLVFNAAKSWAGALFLVGVMIAGGAIILGSQHAGQHLRNVVVGGALLALVGLGKGLYTLWVSWVHLGGGQ